MEKKYTLIHIDDDRNINVIKDLTYDEANAKMRDGLNEQADKSGYEDGDIMEDADISDYRAHINDICGFHQWIII